MKRMNSVVVRHRDRDVLLCEYTQLNEEYKQRDTIVWVMGSIFIPAALAILGYAVPLDTQKAALAISSLAVFGIFRLLLERMRYFARVNEYRMKEIETVLGMKNHCLFDIIERELKKKETVSKKWGHLHDQYKVHGWGFFLGVRCLLDLFMLVLTIAWSLVLNPYIFLFGVLWFVIFQFNWVKTLCSKFEQMLSKV